ncbi:alpha/beta hydrolase family protein [Candidatus Nitrosocosmicus hydrocola]|uniref:alpha/beta hydrolase family protein n=1 Tax=Candidatus Nitrosocosmicus hydrocola TaxID=1826872 RepID=UPI0013727778|nr:prolyl oligopeptidase family serine peptidase [Candidatus Nitrosocosmicus hydrocola]
MNRIHCSNQSLGLLLIFIIALSFLSASIFKQQDQLLAQQFIETIKYRDLVIDLDEGVKTRAQLTLPGVGNGPFPGVLLIPGSGVTDKNGTVGFIHRDTSNQTTSAPTPLLQIAQYLSERGFGVLRYDKRGVGANNTILDPNIWINATASDLIKDSKIALGVLIKQPEIDANSISVVGHSEGTMYAPRVAIDNSTIVKNVILMGILAQNPVKDLYYYQVVTSPLDYAKQILDKNNTGSISIKDLAKDPLLTKFLVPLSILSINNTQDIEKTLRKVFGTKESIDIEKELKPLLIQKYDNLTSFNSYKCNLLGPCPMWWQSISNLIPNLGIIGNISKTTDVLLLNGENDSQTPVQQAFLFQQRLTELNHPDHTLITYPNLGHLFSPSPKWSTGLGPIEQYVLADLYAWLEAHSGLSNIYINTSRHNATLDTNPRLTGD